MAAPMTPPARASEKPPATSPDETKALPASVSQAVVPSKIQGDRIIFNGQYEILLSNPVAELEHPFAEVYETAQKDSKNQLCLAYVIKGHYPARLDVIEICREYEIPNMASVRDYGVTAWHDGTQRMVLLIQRPDGAPLLSRHAPKRMPIPEEILRRHIIKPVFMALQSLSDHGQFHGNVRADNVFWNGQPGSDAVLGEAISSLPGSLQPVLYESIDRAMADPIARGESTASDDIYALGILVAVLLRGYDPFMGKTDRFIIDEKTNRSSFIVMTDGVQLSPRMSDFLRTTLNDDPRLRWTMDQLENWIEGHRAPLKPHATLKKATRALDFNGGKYLRTRLLARDLYDNPAEAVQLIESGNLIKWLDRSLIDATMIADVNDAINRASYNGKSGNYEDKLLCMVSMALDPTAPIRYKTIRAMPTGIGYALLQAIETNQSVQPFAEIIREKIVLAWLNGAGDTLADPDEVSKRFDNYSKMILRRSMDFGLERCFYDMVANAPCLSPMLQQFYVINCQQALYAIDKIGQDSDRPQQPIDRHIAGYFAARDHRDSSNLIALLEHDDPLKRSLSLLTLFQMAQRRHHATQLSGLSGWLSKDAEQIALRYHNLRFRRETLKAIQNEVKSGNLTRLLNLVDNPQDLLQDRHNFEQALLLYQKLDEEQARLSKHLKKSDLFGVSTGRQIGAVVSAILGGIFIGGAILMRLTHFGGM